MATVKVKVGSTVFLIRIFTSVSLMSSQNIGYNELSRNKFFCLTKLLRDLNHSIEIFQVCEYEFDECLGLGDFSNSVFFQQKKR